jgi:hypothetical protein
MKIKHMEKYVNDKVFIKNFISNAEECYKYFGDFKYMFDIYEDELMGKLIGDLLEYCDKNNLISY